MSESFEDRLADSVKIIEPPSQEKRREAFLQRRQLLADFIMGLADDEVTRANSHAQTLFEQGGPLNHPFVVLTPIAGHQEMPETILHALGQYNRQQLAQPFTVLLSLNFPSDDESNPRIEANRQAIAHARELYPDLPIRSMEQSYDPETPIGTIRRDLWNAAVALSLIETGAEQYEETVGLNQDIDLVTLSPHFIATAQYYADWQWRRMFIFQLDDVKPSLPFYTRAKHAFDPRFPNVSHAVFWKEMSLRHEGNKFEAGVVMPFTYYAKQGGFPASHRTGEVLDLMERIYYSPDIISYTSRDNVYGETNIRRYVEKLHTHDFDTVWADDDFGMHDLYRESSDHLTDISNERLEELIRASLDNTMDDFLQVALETTYKAPYREGDGEKIRTIATRELHLAQQVLIRVLHLPEVAEEVKERYANVPDSLASIYATRKPLPETS